MKNGAWLRDDSRQVEPLDVSNDYRRRLDEAFEQSQREAGRGVLLRGVLPGGVVALIALVALVGVFLTT